MHFLFANFVRILGVRKQFTQFLVNEKCNEPKVETYCSGPTALFQDINASI